VQVDAGEHLVPTGVGVTYRRRLHRGVERRRGRARFRRGRQVGHADEPGEACSRRLCDVDQGESGVDRVEQAVEVERGGGGRADAGGAITHEQESGDQHRGQADELRQVEPREEPGHQPDAPQGEVHRVL
jgi:hypothetical protein